MIITDYYRFEKIAEKAKSRIDCTHSTGSYPAFESKRALRARAAGKFDAIKVGDLLAYCAKIPDTFRPEAALRADRGITIQSHNVTSIYIPDVTLPYGYGDIYHTCDAVLFQFSDYHFRNDELQQGAVIEMFIARGESRHKVGLYQMLCDGRFEVEIAKLRERAKLQSDTE